MLAVQWREGPEYPMGIQDSVCGVLGGKFVSAGGFTRHPKDILKSYPDAFGGGPSGFTRLAFAFDPAHEDAGWARIADIPGPARQGAAGVEVGDSLYAIGGFSYSEPLSYREGWRLTGPALTWSPLPDLPWPVCEASAVAIGSRIYLLCAADYFKAPGDADADFHSQLGRNGDPVGSALLMLDTEHLDAGWKRLADMPGVPKFDAAVAAVGGRVYVLGGIYSPTGKVGAGSYSDGAASYHYFNAVDSWVYDPPSDAWTRLPDMPDGANRRALAVGDRTILLISGYKYPQTWLLDGTRREAYDAEEKKLDWKAFFQTTVLAYDTQTGQLAPAAPLLERTSWPGGAILGDTVFTVGGEGGRLWHPATFQIGKVAVRN